MNVEDLTIQRIKNLNYNNTTGKNMINRLE